MGWHQIPHHVGSISRSELDSLGADEILDFVPQGLTILNSMAWSPRVELTSGVGIIIERELCRRV